MKPKRMVCDDSPHLRQDHVICSLKCLKVSYALLNLGLLEHVNNSPLGNMISLALISLED